MAPISSEADPLLLSVEGGGTPSYDGDNGNGNGDDLSVEPLSKRIGDTVKMYWRLGFVAFGGPTAHIGILRDHLVRRNGWIEEDVFMELFALGQGLPGPSSTQLVISTASTHGGALGGAIAFAMWCLPGFVVLTLAGMYLYTFVDPAHPPIWLLGVPPAAMTLIVTATYAFVSKLGTFESALGMVSCGVAVMIGGDERLPTTSSQVVYPMLLVMGGTACFLDYLRGEGKSIGKYSRPPVGGNNKTEPTDKDKLLVKKIGLSIFQGFLYLAAWLGLLVGSIVWVHMAGNNTNVLLNIFEVCFRVGSLIFGGGPVVLPMLQSEMVPRGWVSNEQFFQGLGLAQTMPGPMFNFAAFLGAVAAGPTGSLAAFLGLFGPGFLLIFAMLPFWSRFRHLMWFKAVLTGLNASAVGLMAAGCITLYPKSVRTYADAMVFVLTAGLAAIYGVSAEKTILCGAVLGAVFSHAVLDVGQKHFYENL